MTERLGDKLLMQHDLGNSVNWAQTKKYAVKYTHNFKLSGTKNAAHRGCWTPSWDATTGLGITIDKH